MHAKDLAISSRLRTMVYKLPYLYDTLDVLYSTPRRNHHNLAHIDWCLKQLVLVEDEDILNSGSLDVLSAELEYAILFHDCIYAPGNPNNEMMSADMAYGFLLRNVSSSGLKSAWVTSLIRSTAELPPNELGGLNAVNRVLRDIDHSILAAIPERYHDYSCAIREEYTGVCTDAEYRHGRKQWLDKTIALASKEALFTTRPFKGLNVLAMANLRKEARTWE